MQAEYPTSRGSGFIVSPQQAVPEKAPVRVYKPKRLPLKCSDVIGFVKNIAVPFFHVFLVINKKAFYKLLSVCVAISCLTVFFSLFTFSTGIYYRGEKIGVCQGEKEFFSALNAAKSYAGENGKPSLGVHFKAYPVISLRISVLDTESLKNNMLVCSPHFSYGCSVYSGGEVVFTVQDEKTAREIVNEFVLENSAYPNATLETELTYKTNLLRTEEILTREESKSLICSNRNISVLSVVNSYTSKLIPYETHTENDSSLYIGESVVVSEGKAGTAQIAQKTVYKNKSEQSNLVLSEKVLNEPVTRIVRVGTKKKDVLKSGLFYPLSGTLSSPFGSRWGKTHEGIDLAVSTGTPVKASECGTVSYVNENSGTYGKIIRINHGHGVETAYAHLSEIKVSVGQNVSSDTVIALSGNTGRSTGPHLHFELLKNGEPLDPMPYLK